MQAVFFSPDDENREKARVTTVGTSHGAVVEHHVRDRADEQPDHKVVKHPQHLPARPRLRRALLHRPDKINHPCERK